MKYTKEQYIEGMAGYFGPDEEITMDEISLVKTRKEHECMGSDHKGDGTILVGSMAVRENAIHRDMGRVSCYVCLPCADEWIAEINDEAA